MRSGCVALNSDLRKAVKPSQQDLLKCLKFGPCLRGTSTSSMRSRSRSAPYTASGSRGSSCWIGIGLRLLRNEYFRLLARTHFSSRLLGTPMYRSTERTRMLPACFGGSTKLQQSGLMTNRRYESELYGH